MKIVSKFGSQLNFDPQMAPEFSFGSKFIENLKFEI